MMQAAVDQAAADSQPILVNAKPATWEDAVANLTAFSDERRLNIPSPAIDDSVPPPGLRQISTIPRMKRCYGWLSIHSKVLFQQLSWSLWPPPIEVNRVSRCLSRDKEYIAIVYEFVEEGQNDPETMQKAMDFFWLAGFSRTYSPLLANWKSGVLVDLSDIVPPQGWGWVAKLYEDGPGSAYVLLKQRSELRGTVALEHRGPMPAA
ncbi:hypothetical protein B0T19DRAFT_50752 [Cercophora scortea]|uniref:Uncharacterized protein n=1 Tax=Cercophora scortea TaxID=314031 RepID=A0AAE0J4I7_9PEZI|nr:hypothetical protein B0T19DRAFT_50752 [Cercophora scortea]